MSAIQTFHTLLGTLLDTLRALGPVQWLNAALALAVALVGLGAANRMNRETECTIIVAFATVGAGAIGYLLGTALPGSWAHAFDTLFIGGVLALLIGTRRRTIWIAPAWMPRLSAGVSAITWAAYFAAV